MAIMAARPPRITAATIPPTPTASQVVLEVVFVLVTVGPVTVEVDTSVAELVTVVGCVTVVG